MQKRMFPILQGQGKKDIIANKSFFYSLENFLPCQAKKSRT
jgi:hypothetical protein